MSGQRYKRTNFEDDDISNGGTPPPVDFHPGVVFKGGITLWQKKTTLEKGLFVLVVILAISLCAIASVLAFRESQLQDMNKNPDYCLTPECVTVASSIINTMDRTADPCNNFYQYACGGWIKDHPIPSGHSRWGTFSVLWQENQLVMKNVIEQPSKDMKSESERKAKRYFQSCMDSNKTIEKLGAKPLLDILEGLGGWGISNRSGVWKSDNWILQTAIEKVHQLDVSPLFNMWVGGDDRNSSRNILLVDQSGLGLERDYYLNKSITEDKVLSGYLDYMTTVGVLLGGEDRNVTREEMIKVIQLEVNIAEITIPAEDRRDEEKNYNKMKIVDMQRKFPFLNWLHYFNSMMSVVNTTVKGSEDVVVYAPKFLNDLKKILDNYTATEEGKCILNNYLIWHVVKSLANYLSKPFKEAKKSFTEVMTGVVGNQETWRYCITDTDIVLGFALGSMFVKEAFNGNSKIKAEKMIDEVKTAFKRNLPHLKWMDEETRKAAVDKANSVVDMIGFPEYILNVTKLDKQYQRLLINKSEYFMNNIRNLRFALIKNLERLRKPPKKNAWGMTPPTVNAYYTPSKNEIVFPAGILQAPFYDPNFPKSLNFGAMGVVMGHELTHGFDDQGREFDKYGNLRPWWNADSIKRFQKQTKCMVDQYSKYSLHGEHVRGKQTLGENIADNGGLKSAYYAYEDWVTKNGEETLLPAVGLSHRQLFFMGFAQVWCASSTKENDRLQLMSDAHSPGKFRVIGTLSNSKEFAREFKCPAGSPMNPTEKCVVW